MAAALERLADQGEMQMSECGRARAAKMNEAAHIDVGAQPVETQTEQLKRMMLEGIELPLACRPWRYYPLPTADRLLRAFACGGQRDSIDWLRFCQISTASDSAFFESSVGWLALQNIHPGASAEVHGGAFGGRRGSGDTLIVEPTHALLDYIQTSFNLPVLLSFYAEHNTGAGLWDARFGFKKMGVIPLQDFWNGVPRNVIVTARTKEQVK